jgi:murein DD-endopeptidase MepM/ murein hydrolase activator NlpD
MTRKTVNGAVIGGLAIALSACAATPTYPISSTPAPATKAPAPTSAAQPAPSPSTPPESSSTPPPPVVGVDSSSLGNVEASPPTDGPTPLAVEPPPPVAPIHKAPVRYSATGKVITPRHMYRLYKVAKGDDLDAIARDLDVTPQEIIKSNHLKDADHLVPGQRLKIPVDKAYEARAGDTLAAVARRFGVGAADLASLNGLSEHARLGSGDQIALPSSFHDHGPVAEELVRTPRYASGYRGPPSAYVSSSETTAEITPIPPAAPEPTAASLSDAEISALAHGRFIWPVKGEVLSKFGAKGVGVRNDGLDIRSPLGTVVRAAAPGDVVYAGDQIPGFGNLVLLQHADGWVTAYAHLAHMSVQMRQIVSQGEEIGQVGQTGGVTEPQLHFEVRYKAGAGEKAKPIDPLAVLPAD